MKIVDPEGQVWRVSRRWVPWRPRRREVDGPHVRGWLFVPGDAGELVVLLVIVLVGVAVSLLLAPAIAVAELFLLVLVLPFAVLGRAVLGRHWYVELRRGWSPWNEQPAGDWQASGVRIHEVAEGVRRGLIPVRSLGRPSRGARTRR